MYLYIVKDHERYAFGDEIHTGIAYPLRSAHDVQRFVEIDVVTRLQDAVSVRGPAVVVCIVESAEKRLSDALPEWRSRKVLVRALWRRDHKKPLYWHDEKAYALVLPVDEANAWLRTVAINAWMKIDEILLGDRLTADAADEAEELGWIAWEMLSGRVPGMRRETMVRIVAARSFRINATLPELARTAAARLHLHEPETVLDAVTTYLRSGVVPTLEDE